jgi:hypothetical protein
MTTKGLVEACRVEVEDKDRSAFLRGLELELAGDGGFDILPCGIIYGIGWHFATTVLTV